MRFVKQSLLAIVVAGVALGCGDTPPTTPTTLPPSDGAPSANPPGQSGTKGEIPSEARKTHEEC